jgi:hypothetical protein
MRGVSDLVLTGWVADGVGGVGGVKAGMGAEGCGLDKRNKAIHEPDEVFIVLNKNTIVLYKGTI